MFLPSLTVLSGAAVTVVPWRRELSDAGRGDESTVRDEVAMVPWQRKEAAVMLVRGGAGDGAGGGGGGSVAARGDCSAPTPELYRDAM